jgi:hypothetical protein
VISRYSAQQQSVAIVITNADHFDKGDPGNAALYSQTAPFPHKTSQRHPFIKIARRIQPGFTLYFVWAWLFDLIARIIYCENYCVGNFRTVHQRRIIDQQLLR